ncbi:MAG: carbamoyltransferase [Bacteroidetes bacterium]|jgi:carbamoyltransferase|nr:carbamoyltransferase [Bacteroidota bacterium]
MTVLGIAHDLWIASAALVRDGKVVAAAREERLNRIKKYRGFPRQAVDYCLQQGGGELEDLDLVVSGWNPLPHLEALHTRFSGSARWRSEYLYALPNHLFQHADSFPSGPVEERLGDLGVPLVHVDHQTAHAANAFYLSPYDEAAVFTADGRGERQTALFARGNADGLTTLNEVLYPHSLGLFYGLVTQYLGFRPDSDEWKVMALAAYADDPDDRFYRVLRDLVDIRPDGTFRLDLTMCGYHQPDVYGGRFYTPDFVDAIGMPPRKPDEPLGSEHHALAEALQRVFEETMTAALTALHDRTGLPRVVLGGGCMMNSLYNGKITRQTPFQEAFISSCPDDSGISVGAALWGYHHYHSSSQTQRPSHFHNYWGPSFDDEVEATLEQYGLAYESLPDAPRRAAELLAEGQLLGWFQGAMEFGQRALGNRSILADPRDASVKDAVNRAVKYREAFRPFAPAVLAERALDFFEMSGGERVPFMEKVVPVRPAMQSQIPAVVHADGTGRVQTVQRSENALFYDLIEHFEALTGVPVVLNTSFNLNGEPIVCTPTDAIRTFYSCGLDALILGDYLIQKPPTAGRS